MPAVGWTKRHRTTARRPAGLADATTVYAPPVTTPDIDETSEAQSAEVFRHGVASGDPTSDGLVLWTRIASSGGRPVDVHWSIGEPGEPDEASGVVAAAAEDDFTCHVVVDGLRPGTDYRYSFEADGATIEGRTRTLPASADHVRIVVACCSRWGWPGFERYGAIVDEAPDLVLHLGDYIYEVGEEPPGGPPTEPGHDCITLDDYRARYAQHRTHPALQRLHANCSVLAVWDDHEVVDNAPDDETQERRAAGQRAWREWLPTRPDADSLDRHIAVDGLVDLFLVDSRFRGRRPTDTDGPTTATPDGPILAEAQWRALDDGARLSTAPWFVVANQVQVSPMTLAYAPDVAWPPWRRVINPDQWDGYPDARRRLSGILDRADGRPVVLSGDLHAGWSRALIDGDDGHVVAHEFTSPSISGTTFAAAVRRRTLLPRRVIGWIIDRLNPGIDLLELDQHGYLVLDITPERWTTTFVLGDGRRVERHLDRTTRLTTQGPPLA
jgi:alkaline phosphatase D